MTIHVAHDGLRTWCIGLFIGLWLLMGTVSAAVPPVKIAGTPLMRSGSSTIAGTGLATDGVFVYQSGFDQTTWSGSLQKMAVTFADTGAIHIAATPVWDAADLLTGAEDKAPIIAHADRQIHTARFALDGSLSTVEFKWVNLSRSQQAFLDTSPASGIVDGLGAKRVAYLRGDRSNELGPSLGAFRVRDRLLGDIVNGKPVHVGAPASHISGTGYQVFYDEHKDRVSAVYVGANDGMLHAFDANNGAELFAYIPDALINSLNQLTRPDYAHRWYVDGAMAVAEARVQEKWKTVLVAGMGGGSQGVFALDVTDPADFDGGIGALWEFTDRDDPDMGNVFNVPVIARFKTRLVKGIPEYVYFAVVANGINSYASDGVDKFNPEAPGVLFLLSLDKPPMEKWQLGINYFKFKKPILDPALANGLSAPAVILGPDSAVRHVYAGDLQGNLWRFDFTGSKPWSKENAGTTPLFTATDGLPARQPVTTQPKVVFAPGGGYVVLFGTGKLIEETDSVPANFGTQSFYGIYDTTASAHVVGERSQLEPRTLSKGSGGALHFTGKQFIYGVTAGSRKGWYFDFIESDKTGERSVSNPLAVSGRLIFNSLIPCDDLCPHGGGRSYVLNALIGLPVADDQAGWLSGLGMLNAPVVLDASVKTGRINAFGKAVATKKHAVIHSGTGGAKGSIAAGQGADTDSLSTLVVPVKRFSWREIVNWQELRTAIAKKP